MQNVLITGVNGFIGLNLCTSLARFDGLNILKASRATTDIELLNMVEQADIIFHFAGVNRSQNEEEFIDVNLKLTQKITGALQKFGKKTPIIFASSIHADRDDPYGRSKKLAEIALEKHHEISKSPVAILRLPNVFGKWCRPNYNSVVATFCHKIAHNQAIKVDDEHAELELLHVGDLVAIFTDFLDKSISGFKIFKNIKGNKVTVGKVAEILQKFNDDREKLNVGEVASGFERQLYATFISYLPNRRFKYPVRSLKDDRGTFVEIVKTPNAGQFSYFTAMPGVTRGGHYHNLKTEKFMVVHGQARFCFKNIITGEYLELETSDETPEIVETIPGWYHDVTNIGRSILVVTVWANEIFDANKPDTIKVVI